MRLSSFALLGGNRAAMAPAAAAPVLDTGWVSPTSASDATISAGNAWSNVNNILSSNDTHATCTFTTTSTHELRAGGFDFSAIGDGATITKIEVEIECQKSGGSAVFNECFLINGNAGSSADRIGTDQLSGNLTPNTLADTVQAVPAADLWGATLTPAIVKGANFGVGFRGNTGFGSATVSVDHIRMKVHYTA